MDEDALDKLIDAIEEANDKPVKFIFPKCYLEQHPEWFKNPDEIIWIESKEQQEMYIKR